MTKVTYNDLDGSAPRVVWRGNSFLDGVPVDVDDDQLLAKASGNAFFSVEGESEAAQKRKGGWPLGKSRKPKGDGRAVETQAGETQSQAGETQSSGASGETQSSGFEAPQI